MKTKTSTFRISVIQNNTAYVYQQVGGLNGTVIYPTMSYNAHSGLNRGCRSEVSLLRQGTSKPEFPSSR